jgi:hypothetical protein
MTKKFFLEKLKIKIAAKPALPAHFPTRLLCLDFAARPAALHHLVLQCGRRVAVRQPGIVVYKKNFLFSIFYRFY